MDKPKLPKDDDPKSAEARKDERYGRERDADLAPAQNRPPTELHRGGPLPNQKK